MAVSTDTLVAMIPVYIEEAPRRTFAMAVDWPGWGRPGRTPEQALEALHEHADRYASIAAAAGESVPSTGFEVVELVAGDATTEFGAPGRIPELDRRMPDDLNRLVRLWRAGWERFDLVATDAPEALTKGPRGGGRDTSKVIEHVLAAEQGYARQIGVKPSGLDMPGLRDALVERVLQRPIDTKWPIAYHIRRSAWHVVDHLWEIENRTPTG
jgi:hypothetical protein